MPKRGSAIHVSTHRRHYVGKDGVERDYETHLLRRSYREDGKVKNETVANLSHLPADLIEMIRASLAGEAFVPAAAVATVARTRPHGHVAAVHSQAKALGLPALLGPAGRERDIALALIIARVCRPGSKLATTGWWTDTTLADDLGVADATTDEVYAAMDWLVGRQDGIETKLVRTHLLAGPANPDRLALFDMSSSWVTGRHCPLAARGYSRPGQKGPAPPSCRAGHPRPARPVRHVLLLGHRPALPAGGPRLLPRWEEGPAADRVRAADRPGRAPGGGAGVSREHRRPDRVHHHRPSSQRHLQT